MMFSGVRYRFDNQGIALVLTLMAVALITAMVAEFAYGVYVSTSSLHNWQASQKLSLAARSAIQLGARLTAEKSAFSTYTYPGVFEITRELPTEDIEGLISIRIEDENARFNLNSLVFPNGTVNDKARDSFIRLLKALNLKPEIADRVIDWIDADSIPRGNGYEEGAKNDFLDSIDELGSIPGVEEAAFERLQPYVTIYGICPIGLCLININTADVPVLMSLSDAIDRNLAENVVRYREISPFERTQDILKVAGFEKAGQGVLAFLTVKGSSFRILAKASSGDIQRIIESVMDLQGTTRTVRYWKEY